MRSAAVLMMLIFFAACSGGGTTADTKQVADTTRYYDLPAAIRGEIEEIKRVPRFIYTLTAKNGERDSVKIDTGTLVRMAAPFLQLDLNQPAVKSKYRETVFEDNDTRSFVLSYQTTDGLIPAKSVAVMLDNGTQALKRIDILRSYLRNDTIYEERLAWIAGRHFQLVQITTAGKSELTRQTRVIWELSQ